MAKFLIFGAGKIARGFLGQLLFLSGHQIIFVEKSHSLVELMRSRGEYTVNVLGNPSKNTVVTGYHALPLDDLDGLLQEMPAADGVFTAVGGKNLPDIAAALAAALPHAPRPINVITCENWTRPAEALSQMVQKINPAIRAGFTESVVMRSAIEPDADVLSADPLAVNVQDYWRLPIDRDRLIETLPPILGVELIGDFRGFLERKFYTYNAANGTVSYLGALLGHTVIAEAARDPRIEDILGMVYAETGRALSKRHGIPYDDQMVFAQTSFEKLRDRVIADHIERNARDPLRKLGPEDRLVGSARLAESAGIEPAGLATAIAAAIHYENDADASAVQLKEMLAQNGTSQVLEDICKIPRGSALHALVLKKEQELEAAKWIK